jgi:hypothetical protein
MNLIETKKAFRLDLLVLAVFTMFFGTSIGFSYWDTTILDKTDLIIDIGVGTTIVVSQTVHPLEGTKLVPTGAFRDQGDVYEVVYTYTVSLNKEGQLTVTAKNVTVNGVPNPFRLVLIDIYVSEPNETPKSVLNVEFVENEELQQYQVTIMVAVSLKMPSSQEEYDALSGREIKFDLEFKAEELNNK